MKPYLVSLGIGLLVGILYAAFKVRSPAPPVIALIGLFGMLIGEQIVPLAVKHIFPQAAVNSPETGGKEG
jgi:XapX domain-containing protein